MHRARRSRRSHKWAARERSLVRESDIGHLAGTPREREIFAEGKERIALPHEDAAMIFEPIELDPHHVVDLPLMPSCRRPDFGNGVCFLILLKVALDPQMVVCPFSHSIELIDHRPAGLFSKIVEAADVDEIIKGELVAAILENLFGVLRIDDERLLFAKFDKVEDRSPKAVSEGGDGTRQLRRTFQFGSARPSIPILRFSSVVS